MNTKIGVSRGANNSLRSWTAAFRYLAVLAVLAVFALPAHGADERAVKQRVAPVYPEIAKHMKLGGRVEVEAIVDASGKVVDVKPISGVRMLTQAAQDAVRRWRFEPGAGESKVNLSFNFDQN